MNWIDVNEDLPPKGKICLVVQDGRESNSCNREFRITEGEFCPRKGWHQKGYCIDVILWCSPKGLLDYEELARRLTSEECQAVSETQDESQH